MSEIEAGVTLGIGVLLVIGLCALIWYAIKNRSPMDDD